MPNAPDRAPLTAPATPPRAALAIFLAACAAEILLLVWLSGHGKLDIAGEARLFAGISAAAGAAYLLAVYFFGAIPARFRPHAFWLMALAVRFAVFAMEPGDDVWRYLWEGLIQHQGFNPYVVPPDAAALADLRTPWWPGINHRDWAAIYPPGSEAFFRLLTQWGASVWTFKGAFMLLDLGTVWLILRMHVGPARYRDSAWYAWCPLVAAMLTGAAHFDSALVFLLTASLWALHRSDPMGRQRPATGWLLLCGVALGTAISVKMIPVLLLPMFAFHLRLRFAALLPGLAIPLMLAMLYGYPEVPVFAKLAEFANVARTNDLFWWATEPLWPNPEAKNHAYLAVLAAWVVTAGWIFRNRWRRGALWVLGGALVLSPILHPWYVTWILPLAAWRRAYAWFILAISVNAYFLLWEKTLAGQPWTMEPAWRAMVILPPLLWLAWRGYEIKKSSRTTAAS